MFGKKVVAEYAKELDGELFECFVLDDGEYYNIHVISGVYARDEMNTLKLQEGKEYVTLDYFTPAKMAGYIMEHFIWDRFYNEFGAACITVEIEGE